MEQERFTYVIGEKKYVQRPLTYGQFKQLMKSLRGFSMPDDFDPMAILAALGDRVPRALAVVLLDEDIAAASREELKRYLKHRDLDALAEELEFDLDLETPLTVIQDFFDVNPTVSVSEKLVGLIKTIQGLTGEKTPSRKSSVSSPEETSASVTTSSGAIPS